MLVAQTRRQGSKLFALWQGPAQVVRQGEDAFTYHVRDLLSGQVKLVHYVRLKFFRDASLESTEELRTHLDYQAQLYYVVEAFLAWRSAKQGYELQVKWQGLDDATWEPLETMAQDVPDLVNDFVAARPPSEESFRRFWWNNRDRYYGKTNLRQD